MGKDGPSVSSAFFDSELVMKTVKEGERKEFGRIGAFVRTAARSSLRSRKLPSPVGSPPSIHTDIGFVRTRKNKAGQSTQKGASPLKELLFFAWDFQTESVVIGPTLFAQRRGADPGSSTVPRVLEEGGVETLVEKTKVRTLRFGPRPFMKPAQINGLAQLRLKDMVKAK
jgi:hypothetical protein